MGYVLAAIVWGIVGAIPGAIVGAAVYAVAWMASYSDPAPTNAWWFWGPLVAGALIGVLKGLAGAADRGALSHTPERGTTDWRLDEIRSNTERPRDPRE